MDTNNTRIVISSDECSDQAKTSSRFARCNYFSIYDHAALSYSFVKNEAKNEVSGAGPKAASQIAKLNVDIVLVPEIGPKAFETFQAFGIKVYRYKKGSSVRDTIYDYYANDLQELIAHTKTGKHE
jgi:predicted Fe-Mo cluster-binding NifX family protein